MKEKFPPPKRYGRYTIFYFHAKPPIKNPGHYIYKPNIRKF